jgi:hypothetical protein
MFCIISLYVCIHIYTFMSVCIYIYRCILKELRRTHLHEEKTGFQRIYEINSTELVDVQ